jgi:ribose transport system permease protein
MKANISGKSILSQGQKIAGNQFFIALALLVVLIITGQILAPGFGSSAQIMNILSLSSFLGIIALGQTFVILAGGEGIDLSVGSMVSLSCVMGSQIMDGSNSRILPALIAVLLAACIIGFINGICVSFLKLPPLVVTLAMGNVLAGVALVFTNGQPKGKAAPALIKIGSGYSAIVSNMFIVWLLIMFTAIFVLKKTRFGKILYGVGANQITAALSGANSKFTRSFAYSLSSMIAAIAGLLLLGYTETAYLDIGSTYVMPTVAAVVIGGVSLGGGRGNYSGVVIGAITLTTLNSLLLTMRMSEGGRQMIFGIVLLGLLTVYGRRKNL